ncbi:MAG: hypothetical protein AAFO95_08960, partial [Cyanobacteria bacterium J06600_6]
SSYTNCGGLEQVSNSAVYGTMELLPTGVVSAAVGYSDLCVNASSRVELWVQIALMILRQPIYSPLLRLVIWVISAAYLYQFEFTVKEHLIANAVGRNSDRDSRG